MTNCYGGCGWSLADDERPWLLITGWRPSAVVRIPVALVLCPDCEDGFSDLADQLHDLIGVRLPDNTATSLTTALRGWENSP